MLGADERSARESGAAGATLRAEMDVSVAADDKTRGGRALEEEAALREEEAALRVALAPLHLSLDQRVAAFLSGFFRGFGDASALEEEGYAVVDSSGVSRSSSDASSSEVSDADIEASDAASSSSDASSSASDAASSDRTGSSLPRGDGGASTFFSLVEVRAPSVRLEYLPRAVDFDALVRGSYVEAINLVPFRAVPLTLAPVSLRGVRGGFAGALDATLRAWTSHVAETQTGAFAAGLAPVGGAKNIGTKAREGLRAAAEHARRVARGAKNGSATRRARERETRQGEGEVQSREVRSVSRGVARLVAAVAEEALGLGAHVAAGVAAGAGAADATMRRRRDDPRDEGGLRGRRSARVGVGTEPSGVREGFRRAAETLRRGAADAAREVRAVRTDPRNPTVLGSIPRVAAPAVTAAATAARVAMLGARNAVRKRGAEAATAKTSVGMSERGERVSWEDEEEGEEEWGEGETRP